MFMQICPVGIYFLPWGPPLEEATCMIRDHTLYIAFQCIRWCFLGVCLEVVACCFVESGFYPCIDFSSSAPLNLSYTQWKICRQCVQIIFFALNSSGKPRNCGYNQWMSLLLRDFIFSFKMMRVSEILQCSSPVHDYTPWNVQCEPMEHSMTELPCIFQCTIFHWELSLI